MNKQNVNNYSAVVWSDIYSLLKKNEDLTPRNLRMLKNIEVLGVLNNLLIIEVPDDETRNMIETQIYSVLLSDIQKLLPQVTSLIVKVLAVVHQKHIVSPTAEKETYDAFIPQHTIYPLENTIYPLEKPLSSSEKHIYPEVASLTLPLETNLNQEMTFENFVQGDSNRMAFSASIFISENLGARNYNPLYIYGSSGLGKTHLLNAIGNYICEMTPEKKVLFVNASDYIAEFSESMYQTTTSKNTKSVKEFEAKYQAIDVLLLDDFQQFADKESTTEAFFKLIKHFAAKNKQLVVSADVAPNLLSGIPKRVTTRFSESVFQAIDEPELEMRVAFLKYFINKEKFTYNNGDLIIFSEDDIYHIAKTVRSSIRELAGAVKNIVVCASAYTSAITAEIIDDVLKNFASTVDHEVTLLDILNTTAAYYGVTTNEIRGSSRTPSLVKARHIAIYLIRRLTNMTQIEIAKYFGNRDHTSILNAEKKIKKELHNKEQTYEQVTELLKKLNQLDEIAAM